MSDEGGGAGGVQVIDGRAIAASMFRESRLELERLRAASGSTAGIRVVMAGADPSSEVYARRILRASDRVGAAGQLVALEADVDARTLGRTMRELSDDDSVHGIILQLPLPSHLALEEVTDELDPRKDLDGIHPANAGRVVRGEGGFAPSCAEAAMVMLRSSRTELRGRRAVVIGRSNVVGMPVHALLVRADATVTVVHRQTLDLRAEVRHAEIVVAAAGSPGLVDGDAIRPGAVVIDCGINVLHDGRIVGDVDLPSVMRVASVVTPVPGGVGPVTNAVLMSHLALAASRSARTPTSMSSS